ncbi:hypothetical protein P154DRAFT_521680 [Amniculicola lignicola CBS 123094]|uniref:Uncharacterized protein n=1 Tax=Amniculicola lignicola CBS 123094 TaxID=1392246 RepID=A0A6A5WL49_9PLEO|nr:hypothetical protein P154DRAFT_521680 [Amniculicola lignicola CBS 123094]
MASADIPKTIGALQSKARLPFELGLACGQLLHMIPFLVTTHLDHRADYKHNPLDASIDTVEFTAAVDGQVERLRTLDDHLDPFPSDLEVDRKQRRPRRKAKVYYTSLLETWMREQIIVGELGTILLAYDVLATQQFNKGLDWGKNRLAWRLYPSQNVVFEAGDEDWSAWLKRHCEQLGMMSAREGLSALDESLMG